MLEILYRCYPAEHMNIQMKVTELWTFIIQRGGVGGGVGWGQPSYETCSSHIYMVNLALPHFCFFCFSFYF